MASPTDDNPSLPAGNGPPPKPWERAPSTSGPTPFRPPSTGSTSTVVEASGTAKPGEIVATGTTAANTNSATRPVPPRPWEQNYGNSFGSYGTGTYNSGYGSGMYGGYGSSYGSGLYGNNMYRGGYGQYGSSMYGGGMYGSGYGMGMGGYGNGMGMGMGGPYGNQDPNNPYGGGPPSPPGFWRSFLRVMEGVVHFFGRIAMLIDQNTQAFHMFISALLQLFDRSGMLYGELARFVFRIMGVRTKPRKPQGDREISAQVGQQLIEGPKSAPTSEAWDNVWGNDGSKAN